MFSTPTSILFRRLLLLWHTCRDTLAKVAIGNKFGHRDCNAIRRVKNEIYILNFIYLCLSHANQHSSNAGEVFTVIGIMASHLNNQGPEFVGYISGELIEQLTELLVGVFCLADFF